MESWDGLNESLCDATSLQGLHYGQFFKPARRQSRFAFGRTYYDEEAEGSGNAEAIKYHNYVYVSEDESEGTTARSAVSRTSGGGGSRSAGAGGCRGKRKGTETGKKVPSQSGDYCYCKIKSCT